MKYIIVFFVAAGLSSKAYSQKEKEILFSFGCCFEQNNIIKVYFDDKEIFEGPPPDVYEIVGETIFSRQTIKKGAEYTLSFVVFTNQSTSKESILISTFKFDFKNLRKATTIQFSIPKFYRIPTKADDFTETRAVKTSLITIK